MQDLTEAVKVLNQAKRIMLVGSPRITFDELASLVCLKLLLEDQKKTVSVYLAEDLTGVRKELLDKFEIKPSTNLEPLSYTISIPYDKGEIEKFSYDTDDNQVNLHIMPGESEFDFNSVKYAVEGSNFDAILVVGARKLDWLGDIYTKNKAMFETTKTISLNNLKGPQETVDLKLIDEKKQTTSEMVYEVISLLGGTQNEKIINTLLEGVMAGANLNSDSVISEGTNTIIVNLLNAGADIKAAIQTVIKLLDEKKTGPEKFERPIESAAAKLPKNEQKPKRGKIGKVDLGPSIQRKEGPNEPSRGFIAPPTIEQSNKIPLGAPVQVKPTPKDE